MLAFMALASYRKTPAIRLACLLTCIPACGGNDVNDNPPDASPALDYTQICASIDQTKYETGIITNLPVADVTLAPPIELDKITLTPPSEHWPKQIGVLLLSPQPEDLRAVLRITSAMGLPWATTTAPKLALQHDMAMFFPEAYPEQVIPGELEIQPIIDYLAKGGTLVMRHSDVPQLSEIAGLSGATFDQKHSKVTLTSAGEAAFPSLDRPEEREIRLGSEGSDYLNTWALELAPNSDAEVLARFDDGAPAITRRVVGPGVVYVFGVDFRDTVIRNHLGHPLAGAARAYINVFEPGTDTWLLMVRDIYDARVRFGVRLHTAPFGLRSALLVSHDLDWGPSYDNSLIFAAAEKAQGATSTYFAHTKYVPDSQDNPFFTRIRGCQLAEMLALGHTVGSHTVAHSKMLDQLPLGDGSEQYPTYQPFNVTPLLTKDGSLIGELMVSKSLIDGALRSIGVEHETIAFRAGELSYHANSPETFPRLGYSIDSTRAIGEVLSNFPFELLTEWPDARGVPVIELPVTLEDELPPRIDMRTTEALDIIAANADNGAPTSLLVHPNVTDYKLEAQQEIIAKLPEGVKAMGPVPFGQFWAARGNVEIRRMEYDEFARTLTVTLFPSAPITGLGLRVSKEIVGVDAPSGATISPLEGGMVVALPDLPGGEVTTVTMRF